jgi:hypothetical protein
MTPDLSTTNTLLGIMALVSILEGVALVALIGGGFLLYRRVTQLIAGIEERQIAPITTRVTSILDDVKGVSATVKGAADAADSGVRWGLAWILRRIGQLDRS